MARTPAHERLIVVPPAQFAAAALAAFRHALTDLEAPVIGLPTGRTPIELYRKMAFEGFAFPQNTRLFALDEYCSPEPHPGTNAAFFATHMPSPPLPRPRIPKHDAPDPDSEITAFCNAIAAAGGFDLAVLGIGTNGHIAFNEPGSSAASSGRTVVLAPPTRAQVASEWDPAPTRGMTVGMKDLLDARRLLLLATGSAKAQILAAAIEGPVTSNVPASLLQNHPALTVICDFEAASHLQEVPPSS